MIQNGLKAYKLSVDEILYLKSNRNHVEFYLKEKDMFFVRNTLNDISMSEGFKSFIRTHNRYLINPVHVFHYSYRTMIVGNTEIPISEKYRPILRKMFN